MTAPTASPPALPDTRSRWARVQGPTLLAAGVLAASVALHVRDPHQQGSWGFCPWLALTGTYCPGCGGLRAVNDLGRGDLAGAVSSNLLLVAALPVAGVWWLRRMRDGWRGVRRPLSDRRAYLLTATLLGAAAVFWVVRNLPFASWLTP